MASLTEHAICQRYMTYNIIVFKNLRFRPNTRKQEAGVFKNLYSGKRFWKDAFCDCFHWIRVDGRPNQIKKTLRFQTKTDFLKKGKATVFYVDNSWQ